MNRYQGSSTMIITISYKVVATHYTALTSSELAMSNMTELHMYIVTCYVIKTAMHSVCMCVYMCA